MIIPMSDCLFCKIIAGDVPAEKVYEDEHALAFLDISPVNKGHVLVVPKEHSKNIFEISEETLRRLVHPLKIVSESVRNAVGAGGINIHWNNEAIAGQAVFHTHLHVIPRFEDDDVKLWKGSPYEEGEEETFGEKIRNAITQ